ncbi:MAG: DUF5995 family protein [Candidatus Dormibacteria bacterium]
MNDMSQGGRRARHRMTALLERWETCADGRADFARSWGAACESIAVAARWQRFGDCVWVMTLLDLLVDFYFITVEPDGDDLALVTAGAWSAAHEYAAMRPRHQRRAVLLGYNALISNDLPQAVGDLLSTEWPLTSDLTVTRQRDVRTLCDMIALGMRGDGDVARAWCAEVWPHALALVTAGEDFWRDLIRDDIELTALRRAHLIACDIESRDRLLALPVRQLDQVFPVHHEKPCCRLSSALPTWGIPAPASP